MYTRRIITLIVFFVTIALLSAIGSVASQASNRGVVQAQNTITLTAVADATIRSWLPDTNFGSESTLEVSYNSSDAWLI